jgi:hypothetical protein
MSKTIAVMMAEKMLNNPNLPATLVETLNRASELAYRLGGQLRSRQIVATIVTQWEVENRVAACDLDKFPKNGEVK